MADKQLIVHSDSLQTIGSRLDSITQRLNSQTLTVSLPESRGALIDKLNSITQSLNEIGTSLETMTGQTAKLVYEIDKRFSELENTLIDLLGGDD